MIKSITNFLIIFFIFQQLKSQISQIDQNGYNAFCDETLHIYIYIHTLIYTQPKSKFPSDTFYITREIFNQNFSFKM